MKQNATLSVEVMANIALVQNMVPHLPDKQSVMRFVCRGLESLPGASGVDFILDADAGGAVGTDDDRRHRFPLQFKGHDYGALLITVSHSEQFQPYIPYLENLCQMVAVIFEDKRHRQMIKSYSEELERKVEEKTEALRRHVKRLEHEIAERRRAERSLRETKRLLDETQALTRLGGWEYDIAGDQLTWTDEVYRIHGLQPGEGPDSVRRALDFYTAEDIQTIETAFRRAVETGAPYDLELTLTRADGMTVWVRTMGRAVVEDGRIVRVGGNIIDITERKRAEAEREKLREQLVQAQKMESVGRLAGGVAHDFNNMLGVILGHAEMALDEMPTGHPLHADLIEIQKAAERSANLTRQLLAFARKQTTTPRELDLNETVTGMLSMLQRLIGEDITLCWTPGPDLWPVRMDPGQIDQILANLCVNARDAIGGIGTVIIETSNTRLHAIPAGAPPDVVPGEYVLLSVRDDGCGMGDDTIARLFEPFFTTKGVGKGTGLGLATVYGITRQNGGFIDVMSAPGDGATFRIFLPRYRRSAPVAEAEPVDTGATGNVGETVLLVEDEPAILALTRTMLEKLHYRVLTAATPGEALAKARSHAGPIHLLMTDVVMPEMNGRDLAKQVLPLYPGIKRLFMSGYTADVIAHHGVLEESVHFIEKPFTKTSLAAKVRQALDPQ